MAKVALNKAKLRTIMVEGEGTLKVLKERANEIKEAAIADYLGQRVLENHNNYVSSFKVTREGRGYLVRNTAPTAFWVEFGAHAGGKTAVLGYAPLRNAIDIVSSNH